MIFKTLAAVLLTVSIPSFAQVTGGDCAKLISKSNSPPSREIWKKLAKSENQLQDFTLFIQDNRKSMIAAAKKGLSFERYLNEAKSQKGALDEKYNVYHERIYLKYLVAEMCEDSGTEASLSQNSLPGANSLPPRTMLNQIRDVTGYDSGPGAPEGAGDGATTK